MHQATKGRLTICGSCNGHEQMSCPVFVGTQQVPYRPLNNSSAHITPTETRVKWPQKTCDANFHQAETSGPLYFAYEFLQSHNPQLRSTQLPNPESNLQPLEPPRKSYSKYTTSLGVAWKSQESHGKHRHFTWAPTSYHRMIDTSTCFPLDHQTLRIPNYTEINVGHTSKHGQQVLTNPPRARAPIAT